MTLQLYMDHHVRRPITTALRLRGVDVVTAQQDGAAAWDDDKLLVATPDIPLAWPLSVGTSEKKIYVGDLYNRRVVRVDKRHVAEEICEVK